MIPWRPIAELPDALKDGREVLLWETVVEGRAEFATWDPAGPAHMPAAYHLAHGVWCDRDGATIHGITHFAEIDAPQGLGVHPSDRLARAVDTGLGNRIRTDEAFAAHVWGALVHNNWFGPDGVEGMLTYRGADSVIQDIRGDGKSFYMEGVEGPPNPEMAAALAAQGWTWKAPFLPTPKGRWGFVFDWLRA